MASFQPLNCKPISTPTNRNIRIIVRPLQDTPGEYMGIYTSEVLQVEFSVTLKDSLFGALSL